VLWPIIFSPTPTDEDQLNSTGAWSCPLCLTENLLPIRQHHFQVHFSQIDSPLRGSSDCLGERSSHMESSESMVVWHSYHSGETYKIQNSMRIDRWPGDLCAHINFPLEYNMTDVLCDIQKGNAFPLSDWFFGWAEATWEIELTGSLDFLKNGAIATLTQPFKQGKPRCRTPPQVQSNASSSELAMRVLAASCCILYPGCPGPHLCNGFSTIPALDHQ
jgi:hypothetical protein